jgi:uncharacterized protein (DUF1778 family)
MTDTRSTHIQARCTPEEHEAIRRRAKAAGVSLSRYVVLCALGAPPPPLPVHGRDDD